MESSYPMTLKLSVLHLIKKFISITIGEIVSPEILIRFDSSYFDIIPEMSWLCTYEFKIDCD